MRLYKRAVSELGPLWHLDAGRTCFIGPLTYNAPHQHGAAVLLNGIYGSFLLRVGDGPWRPCRTAVIPAGVLHELDVRGEPIGVLYIEPTVDGAAALVSLAGAMEEVDGALIGAAGDAPLMRELWEDAGSANWVDEALDDLLAFGSSHARRHMDLRITKAINALRPDGKQPKNVEEIASLVGLSSHRFQHLFTREVGVPYRRYRAWMRMRAAIAAVAQGTNFTNAAHAAGFFDQAHFTRDFCQTFGAPPSRSLIGVRVGSSS